MHVYMDFQASAYHISVIKGGLCVRAGVAENLWFKRKTAEEEANPHMSPPKTIILLSPYIHHSFQVIISSSFPCQYHVVRKIVKYSWPT